MCCGTCNIIRIKSPDIYSTYVELTNETLPANPTIPVNPPTGVAVGHTLIERYDDGIAWWTWNGTTWDLNFTWQQADGCCTFFNNEPGNTLSETNPPAAPLNPPANPNTGDTLIENYDNGQVYWTFNGTTWVRDFVVVADDIYNTHSDQGATNINENALPGTPVNPPTGVIAGHTLHELYGNAQIYWTYNGANWVRDYVITDCCHTQTSQVGNTLNCDSLPSAPISTPSGATTGDTLHERYANGSIYWRFNGTNWIYQFNTCDVDIYNTHSNQSASAINTNSLPANPILPPTGVEPGHTLHELYSNGQIFWTFNGTGWTRDYVIVDGDDCCTTIDSLNSYDCANPPTQPTNPPANPSIGDTHFEFYTNGLGNNDGHVAAFYWEYNGTTWTLVNEEFNVQNFVQELNTALDTANLPATPAFPGLTTEYVNGDTLTEYYTNGIIIWIYRDCEWSQEVVRVNTEGNLTTVSSESNYDCSTTPSVPNTSPSSPSQNDTHIEVYDAGRVKIYWTYNGTAWIQNVIDYDPQHYQITNNTAIDTANLPVLPTGITDTSAYLNGDTIFESFTNGYIIWTVAACTWVRQVVRTTTGCCTTLAVEANYDCANPPTVPVNPPTSAADGDTHFEYYSNGTRTLAAILAWEYDGTVWTLVSTQLLKEEFVADLLITNIDIDGLAAGTAHTAPITPGATTDYVNGDTLKEEFQNGEIHWKYVDCAWVRQTVDAECDCCDEPYITPIITADCQTICAGGTVNFTDESVQHSSTTQVCTYTTTTWDFGDGTPTQSGQTVGHQFDMPGLYFVSMTTNCSSGATATQTVAIQVSQVEAMFVVDDNTIASGDTVTITNQSNVSGCNATYLWDFGDGATSTEQNPGTHTYNDAGTFTISLTITCDQDCGGDCTDTHMVVVTVNSSNELIPSITADVNAVCVNNNEVVTLTDSSTSSGCTIDTWLWEVSTDGGVSYNTIATTQNTTYTPTSAGTHVVRLTVECSSSSVSASTTQNITASEVAAAFTVDDNTPSVGQTVTLTDTTVIGGCTLQNREWTVSVDGGASTVIGSGSPQQYTPTVEGTHSITLTVTCANGCSDTVTVDLIVEAEELTTTLTVDDDTVCNGAPATGVNITATTTGTCTPDTHEWSLSVDGGVSTIISNSAGPLNYIPGQNGVHVITYTATCSGSGTNATDTITINVINLQASFTGFTANANVGDTFTLTNTSTIDGPCTPDTFVWEISDDNGATFTQFATTEDATFTFATAGTYQFRYTISCGDCSDVVTSTNVVVIESAITADFTASDLTVCVDDVVTLTNTSTADGCALDTQSWTVSVNGAAATEFATTFDATYTPNVSGVHVITLTQNCDAPATDTQVMTIQVASVTAAIIISNPEPDTGEQITLSSDDNGIVNCTDDSLTYLWEVSNDGGTTFTTIGTTASVNHTPATAGDYIYRLTTTCDTHECSGTTTRQISVTDPVIINAVAAISDNTICLTSFVFLNSNGSTITNCTGTPTYFWEISEDNGATWVPYLFSQAQNPFYNGVSYGPGLKQMRVTVTCDGVSDTSDPIDISVARVFPEISVDDSTVELGDTIVITFDSTDIECDADEYEVFYQPTDPAGPIVSLGTFMTPGTVNFTPPAVGSYRLSVSATCTSHNNCGDSESINIEVDDPGEVIVVSSFSTDDDTVCINDVVTLTDTGDVENCVGTPTYSWEVSTDGGATFTEFATTQNTTYTPTTAGTHQVRLTVTCDAVSNTSTITSIQAAEIVASYTVDSNAIQTDETVQTTNTSTITNCTGLPATYNWEYSLDGGAFTFFSNQFSPAFNPPEGPGNYELRLTVSCPSHGCSDTVTSETIVVTESALPCVDAECYIARTTDNPNSTRMWSLGGQGFDSSAIQGGGQNFTVDGHPTADLNLIGSGQFRSNTPLLLGDGTSGARVRVRNSNGDPNAVLTLTFDEPVCGVISAALGTWTGGTNPAMIVTSDGTLTNTPRSDFTPNLDYAGTNPVTATVPSGENTAYGLINFDNATSIEIQLQEGQLHFGMYVANGCEANIRETNILYCPTADEFYVRNNAGVWVLTTAYTELGEWSPATC